MAGTKFIGTSKVETTTQERTEIIPTGHQLYRINLTISNDCMIEVNGVQLLIGAGQTFNTDRHDPRITSLVIVGKDNTYTFIGAI